MDGTSDPVALLEARVDDTSSSFELPEFERPFVPSSRRALDMGLTGLIVVAPLVALGWALVHYWGRGIGWLDLGLTVVLYELTGHGLTIGFHRLFAHRGFHCARWLKIVLAIAGSLGVEGSLISWVALHRRHHAYSDRPGDPHSPLQAGNGEPSVLRGLFHAHVGWLFASEPVEAERWCPELLEDRDLVRISAPGPLWLVASLALPFLLGLLVTRTLEGAALALVWGGLVRIGLVHHVTWSVNSLGHTFGRRPYPTNDGSRNVAALALASFGEGWHNNHHAFPALARHGSGPGELDTSAALIRLFESRGWVSQVRWPNRERMARVRARSACRTDLEGPAALEEDVADPPCGDR